MTSTKIKLPSEVKTAQYYVEMLFQIKLPKTLVFHNFHHTKSVVAAAQVLCENMEVTEREEKIILMAACFHDSGNVVRNLGHEVESGRIAKEYLEKMHWKNSEIADVLACIQATRMPQQPQNEMQQILCDADLGHLSQEHYLTRLKELRREWKQVNEKQYDDYEWYRLNIDFLATHEYFTEYARTHWQPNKEKNVDALLDLM